MDIGRVSSEAFRNADFSCPIHGEDLVDGLSCSECGALREELEERNRYHRSVVASARRAEALRIAKTRAKLMRDLP